MPIEKTMEWYIAARAMQGCNYKPETPRQCSSCTDITGLLRLALPDKSATSIRCIATAKGLGRMHVSYMLEDVDMEKRILRMQVLPKGKMQQACMVMNTINSRYDVGKFVISHTDRHIRLEVDYMLTGDALKDGMLLEMKEERCLRYLVVFVPLVCMACADNVDLDWVLGLIEDASKTVPGATHKYELYMSEIATQPVSDEDDADEDAKRR